MTPREVESLNVAGKGRGGLLRTRERATWEFIQSHTKNFRNDANYMSLSAILINSPDLRLS